MTATPSLAGRMALHGVDHTARPTWKLRETVEFYRDILGLKLVHAITAKGWGREKEAARRFHPLLLRQRQRKLHRILLLYRHAAAARTRGAEGLYGDGQSHRMARRDRRGIARLAETS